MTQKSGRTPRLWLESTLRQTAVPLDEYLADLGLDVGTTWNGTGRGRAKKPAVLDNRERS